MIRARNQMAAPTTRSPEKPVDSIWNFLLMVLGREEEGISNHFKAIPDGSMCSKIVEKASPSAECRERLQPGGNPLFTFRCV